MNSAERSFPGRSFPGNSKLGDCAFPDHEPERVKEKEVLFSMTDEGMKLMAVFVSQLVREGVTFKTYQGDSVYTVELTGGY